MTRQLRTITWPSWDYDIRAAGDGMSFSGYAAVFDRDSEPMIGIGASFVERIAPGAFTRTLKRDAESPSVKMFLNHNSDSLLASTRGKTLRVNQDDTGLLAEAELPDTTLGRDTAELVRRGDITSMSFGFFAIREKQGGPGKLWEPTPGTETLTQRYITEAQLVEVSPVTGWPAYPDTSAAVRALAQEAEVEPDVLASAFAALRSVDPLSMYLNAEQRKALLDVINARTAAPVVSADVAEWTMRIALLEARTA